MNRPASSVQAMVMTRMTLAMALTEGSMPRRSIPQMRTGSVASPPLVKKVITSSSNDQAATISTAPSSAGATSGKTTSRNDWKAVAPRSRAASSYERIEPHQPGVDDDHHERQRHQRVADGGGPEGRVEPDLAVEGEERDPQEEGGQNQRRGDEGGEGIEPAGAAAREGKGGAGAGDGGEERHDKRHLDAVQQRASDQRVAERLPRTSAG